MKSPEELFAEHERAALEQAVEDEEDASDYVFAGDDADADGLAEVATMNEEPKPRVSLSSFTVVEDPVTGDRAYIQQPKPTPNNHPPVLEWALRCVSDRLRGAERDAVVAALRARDGLGRERYGASLQPFNGRSAMRDATEEALDLVMYVVQRGVETTDDEGCEVSRNASLDSEEYSLVIDVLNAIVPLLPRMLALRPK